MEARRYTVGHIELRVCLQDELLQDKITQCRTQNQSQKSSGKSEHQIFDGSFTVVESERLHGADQFSLFVDDARRRGVNHEYADQHKEKRKSQCQLADIFGGGFRVDIAWVAFRVQNHPAAFFQRG